MCGDARIPNGLLTVIPETTAVVATEAAEDGVETARDQYDVSK